MRSRGFTLVELMAVVAIVAVLAVVATFSYKRYMRRARHLEGAGFLMDIKLKQEAYFMTYSRYVSTGGIDDFYPPDAQFKPDKVPVPWGSWDCGSSSVEAVKRFCELGIRPTSELTYFQYVTVGWSPTNTTPPSGYIQNAARRWWIARARTYPENSASHSLELRLTSEFNDIAEIDGP